MRLFVGFIYSFYLTTSAIANPITVPPTLQKTNLAPLANLGYTPTVIKSCKGIHSANTPRKVVALTFDDGPHKKYTDDVLLILKQHGIKATFFLIGTNIQGNEGVVRKMNADGHIIGNHSYWHYRFTKLSKNQIAASLINTSKLVSKITRHYPILLRPPYGACSTESVTTAKKLGFKTIMWSAMVADYFPDLTTAERIAIGITNLVKPGTIIGLHDGGGNREKTVEALPIILTTLKNQGYEFLTIPELLKVEAYLPEEDQK